MMIYSIESAVQAQTKIQRSEFIAYLHPVANMEATLAILKDHQMAYANATHNCYAYVLGYAQETQYYADAGEPGGTAGKPILNSLLRNDLSGVLAVVTRYYGGIKLGVKGLIDAYTEATQMAIELAILCPYIHYLKIKLCTDYGFLESLRHQLLEYEVQELSADYTDKVQLELRVPEVQHKALCVFLAGYKAMGRLDFDLEDLP